METCAGYTNPNSATTVTVDATTTVAGSQNELGGLCPPDKYFRSQKPSYGNPYRGCMNLHTDCDAMYDRGYCQLKPATINCQESCGRCIGDDAYMPWNPIRAQLIQWALNRRDDGTAKALANYFLRQYADYMSEVHRSCRPEILVESERRHTQQPHHRRHGGRRDRDGENDSK